MAVWQLSSCMLHALPASALSLRKLIFYLNGLSTGLCMKTALDPGTAMIGLMRDDPLTFTFLGGARGHRLPGILLSPVGSGMTFSYLRLRTGRPS